MINIICKQDKIYYTMIDVCNHIDQLEENINECKNSGIEIPKELVIELCVSNSILDELLRLRRLGL